jgi:hypothetical protein
MGVESGYKAADIIFIKMKSNGWRAIAVPVRVSLVATFYTYSHPTPYTQIWAGADDSVQLCDSALPLGDLHCTRPHNILFGPDHRQACRDAFLLSGPNCTCSCEESHPDARLQPASLQEIAAG